jgi:AraC family transcriptional regulator, positive regulator of tynA and feaB
MRVCGIIKDRFADPGISPHEVGCRGGNFAALFAEAVYGPPVECSHYIISLRLDHAARLIERRALMKTGQALSEIAYACGFRDYTQSARGFRRRFGITTGAVGAGATDNGRNCGVRPRQLADFR